MVALVPNLMDRGPVEAAVRSAGATLEFAATPELLSEAVAAGARLAVVDLAVPGVMAVVATLDAVTVGFGSHVDRAMLDRARDGGCDEVLPRSALAHRLARIIRARVDGGPDGGDSARSPD